MSDKYTEYLKGIVKKIPKEEAVSFYLRIPKDYFKKFYELKELREIRTNGLLFCHLLEAEMKTERRKQKVTDPETLKGVVQTILEEDAVAFYLRVPKDYFKKFHELKKSLKIRTNGLFFCHLLDAELKRERRRIKDREKQEKQKAKEKKGD